MLVECLKVVPLCAEGPYARESMPSDGIICFRDGLTERKIGSFLLEDDKS